MVDITATEAWRLAYPGAAAGFLVMSGVVNPRESAALEARKTSLEAELRARCIGDDGGWLKRDSVLSAYAVYYKRFKKTYHVVHQLRSVACEGKPIPRRAALVEAMFMAELANGLLTAGHDLALVESDIRIDVATGDERYTPLGGSEQATKRGDMFIADEVGILSSIIYGPDQRTPIGPGTTAALFTVYAPPGVARTAVEQHMDDIVGNVCLISPDATVELSRVLAA